MAKMTTANFKEITDTVEIRGDVEVLTMPIKLDGYWYAFEGVKFIFLHKDLSPLEREDLIQTGLEKIKTYSEAESEK